MSNRKAVFPSNLHGHTTYCDGKNKAEDYIRRAIGKGFESVGLSGHSYTAFDPEYCMSVQGTEEYLKELKELKEKYRGKIQVYVGIEADFYSGYDKKTDKEMGLDFRIGSVHYVKDKNGKDRYYCIDNSPEILEYGIKSYDNGNVQSLIEAYYDNIVEMLYKQRPDIIGHLDLVKKFNRDNKYFDENAGWYKNKVKNILDEIAKTDAIVEINTGGMSRGWTETPYPSIPLLEKILEKNIPITISSDVHAVENIDFYFEESVEIAKKVGFDKVKILKDGKFEDFSI